MDKIEKIRAEIERLYNDKSYSEDRWDMGYDCACEDMMSFLSTLESEEPDKSLYEAAEEYARLDNEGVWKDGGKYKGFIAGAEWQKEQDQPITGNSLEQEWLRYVDRKKKECGGELPALGEYGWLQIARHFAEWQKKQTLMPEDTALFQKGVEEGKRLMMEEAVEGEVHKYDKFFYVKEKNSKSLTELLAKFNDGDKIKIIIVKEK